MGKTRNMSEEPDSSAAYKVALAVGAVALAGGLAYAAYTLINPEIQDNDPESENPLLRPSTTTTSTTTKSTPIAAATTDDADTASLLNETNELIRSVDSVLSSAAREPARDPMFPFTFEDYKQTLGKLHQCFCGKSAGDGSTLSRCGFCKATYYCGPEHQRHCWSSAPFHHKKRCGEMTAILTEGFSAIERYMVTFSPQNAPNVQLNDALEGWSIICAALERRIFADAYEEAKLVHWAGTTHAMLCGQLMRQTLKSFELESLLRYFAPSINFFENVLAIAVRSDRGGQLTPFANFELFGLWSSLGLSMKETDPARMEQFFINAAQRFGIPAIEGILELLASADTEDDMMLQSLQQWTQSVITILTQKKASFAQAEQVTQLIGQFAGTSQNLQELHTFSQCLYSSAVQAHEMVVNQLGKPDADWTDKETEMYGQARQQILQALMARAFPEVMQQMAAAGGAPPQ